MSSHDPDEVIASAEARKADIREHALAAVEWFLDREGLDRRGEAVDDLAAHLDVDREVANLVVGHLVEDDADPVQQVVDPVDGKYVGVIDHAEHEWFYAFDRYDDVDGRERRAVCAHCVHEERTAADVAHVTRAPDEYDLDGARLALAVHYHVEHEDRAVAAVLKDLGVDPVAFTDRHDLTDPTTISVRDVTRRLDDDPDLDPKAVGDLSVPEVDVEPGASLVAGTTIGGSIAWHAGNDGAGSGLDADTLDGKQETDVWRFIARDWYGEARLYGFTSAYTNNVSVSTGDYKTLYFSPTTSHDAGFLYARGYSTNFTINDVYRNAFTLTPEVGTLATALLVTRVTGDDTFTFKFSATSSTTNTTFSAVMFYGQTVAPTAYVLP